jgi:dolichol-phosphate mannosyltransferase
MSILVGLATYNEIENLPGLVDAIFQALPEAHVLVVDDNSPDGTGRWCDEKSAVEPRLRCLHRSGKLGLGTATLAAIHHAIQCGYDVLVTLDADWSHDPARLPELVGALRNADVAVGSRYVSGGKIIGWPWYRRVVSRVLNAVSRQLLRLPVRDSSGAFRAYRVAKMRELPLDHLQAGGYAYLEEILWHLCRIGASILEVPITFRDRRGGRSKADWREAIGKIGTIVRLMVWR